MWVEGVVLVIPGENKDYLTNTSTCISNTPSPIPNIQSASVEIKYINGILCTISQLINCAQV